MENKFASALKQRSALQSPRQQAPVSRGRSRRTRSKHIGGYFHPAVSTQLRHLAVEENSTVQQLLEEALDLLFRDRGKNSISQILRDDSI